jgi:crossover junction endodeoxyribonuclease RusA
VKRLSFHVTGTPKPQGSKRHVGNGVMIESAGQPLKTWREDVKHAAADQLARSGVEQISAPVMVAVTFALKRPASHYRTGKNAALLRESAPLYPAVKPDIDKLARSTLDALTSSGLISDDSRIVALFARKQYAPRGTAEGADVVIDVLPERIGNAQQQ